MLTITLLNQSSLSKNNLEVSSISDSGVVANVVQRLLKVNIPNLSHANKDIIVSIKNDREGNLLVVEEVRTGKKELTLDSMRKYPATSDATSVARTVTLNVRNDSRSERIIIDRRLKVNIPNLSHANDDVRFKLAY